MPSPFSTTSIPGASGFSTGTPATNTTSVCTGYLSFHGMHCSFTCHLVALLRFLIQTNNRSRRQPPHCFECQSSLPVESFLQNLTKRSELFQRKAFDFSLCNNAFTTFVSVCTFAKSVLQLSTYNDEHLQSIRFDNQQL